MEDAITTPNKKTHGSVQESFPVTPLNDRVVNEPGETPRKTTPEKRTPSKRQQDEDPVHPSPAKKLCGRVPYASDSYGARYAANKDVRYGANNGSGIQTESDCPDSNESFLLNEGEKKIELEVETRVPNAAMFTFNKEDHTLGNLLKSQLMKSKHVLFAGYQVPHPLFATFKLRVQTDGTITPKQAVKQASQDLIQELQTLDQEFTKEWELKKVAVAGGGD